MVKQRIEWIDTAKGLCILLVVLHHVSIFFHIGYPLSDVFIAFRMPLYFILSGLFFKTYSGILDFSIRKINKLLIPYLFFFTVGGVILPVILFHCFDFRVWSYKDYGLEAFSWIFSERIISNPSIWFLICLFEVNLIFYFIQIICNQFSSKTTICAIFSFVVGGIGLFMSWKHFDLPYFVDSALSATPFFFFGWYLRNNTTFLSTNLSKTKKIVAVPLCIVVFLIIHYFSFGRCGIMGNSYGGLIGILHFYPYGIIGTLAILQLAHIMGLVPFISYIGRYSIIILCTHAYIIQLTGIVFSLFIENDSLLLLSTFLMTAVLNCAIIPIFLKWLPYVTAQKDILKYQVK